MEIASLPKVECAILHRQFDLLDNDIVFDAIQKLAARLKFAPEVQLMDTSSDTVLHVHVGGHRVRPPALWSPAGGGAGPDR